MAHQSLYRRYRSQRFSEILGQPHVTTGLQSAVAEGRESHAYLFSGPRGTGKTSTARVLAKALNCENLKDGEPCCECTSCKSIESGNSFDIHELDAASHNKVDDIRELIGKVHLGTPGRTKVYILDEVHMLSSGAENALLKTLEEPPEHVVFVLATTEPQKVVSTIRSRTQHFQFHLLPSDVLAEHLRWVIADAGLDVTDEGIEFALRQGGGSARDTLSALDLVVAAGGVPGGGEVAELLVRAIGDHDPARAMASIQEGLEFGREPRTIGEDALDLLRNAFLSAMGAPLAHLSDRQQEIATEVGAAIGAAGLTRALESIGQALVEMRQAPDPRVPLEVTVLRLARSGASPGGPVADAGDTAGLQARIASLEARIADLEARLAAGAQPAVGATPSAAPPAAPTASASRPTIPRPGQASAGTTDEAAAPGGTAARPPRPPRPDGGPPRSPRAGAAPSPSRAPRPGEPASAPGESTSSAAPDTAPPPIAGQGAAPPSADTPAAPGVTAPRPAGGGSLSVAAVTSAWGPLLDTLSQKVRARFKGGRITAVDGGSVTFGVPNAIARDRCLQVSADLEAALAQHFGHAVQVHVVIDDQAAAPIDVARIEPRPAANAPSDLDEDIGPVSELVDATDQSANGIDRLTKAFPGSEVIDA